jgi:hypothetical protein
MSDAGTDDRPITLDEAVRIFFGGSITSSTLKAEIKRGRLRAYKLGRRYFTTPADVKTLFRSRAIVSTAPPTNNIPTETDALTAQAALLARLGARS